MATFLEFPDLYAQDCVYLTMCGRSRGIHKNKLNASDLEKLKDRPNYFMYRANGRWLYCRVYLGFAKSSHIHLDFARPTALAIKPKSTFTRTGLDALMRKLEGIELHVLPSGVYEVSVESIESTSFYKSQVLPKPMHHNFSFAPNGFDVYHKGKREISVHWSVYKDKVRISLDSEAVAVKLASKYLVKLFDGLNLMLAGLIGGSGHVSRAKRKEQVRPKHQLP